ncbi:MAG: hypothetical protein M2R45_00809 [Verrucomicrobia subdivision 3 bacterium]|nr:hypothetical protein [Limisphaerales bacterium]MCS1413086.1 hypothetical protein [Limisphaerales bacterium]
MVQHRVIVVTLLAVFSIGITKLLGASPSSLQLKTHLEVLNRIDPRLYHQSSKVRQLVNDSLDALQGEPRFVELALRFGITNRTASFLLIADRFPNHAASTRAVAYLLDTGATGTIQEHLEQNPNSPLSQTLGRTTSAKAFDIIVPLLFNEDLNRSLANTLLSDLCRQKEGAKRLLQELSQAPFKDVEGIAEKALALVRQTPWTDLKTGYEALFPSSPSLPDVSLDRSELIAKKGNMERGREVFRDAQNTCLNCHKAEGMGSDVGPDLSEIGKKLGKDALYEAILNPNAGISFGYEGWDIILESGDELSGIIISEQEDQLTLRNLLGDPVIIPKKDIFEKHQMTSSLMPGGLGQVINRTDLVDLVEYLSQLGN